MKIAFICTEKLPVPPISGGAVQIYIEGVLPELSKHHDITVFSIKHESLKDEEEINGVKYIRVAAKNKAEYIRNVKLKLNDSFDLIHVFNRPLWVSSISKKLPKAKFSLSLHNEMFHKEKISQDMGLECINKVEFITTVSEFVADSVRQRYPEADKKLHPVYSGVDINKFKPAFSKEHMQNKETLKKELGIEDKKVVLFVGRLGEKKGADKLITAMKSIMDLRSDVALVIIGSKWYGENVTDDHTKSVVALSKSLKGPVIFTGYLPQTQIPSYFNIGDIFVCPSQWREPLARVHYEAMAAGLPIITTNRGGNKEVIEGYGNGIIIDDYSNPNAFSEQILMLLNDPAKAASLGQKGRSLAEEKYNWNRVANELLSLINKVGDLITSEESLPEEFIEIKHEPKAITRPDVNIDTNAVSAIEVPIENQPDVPVKENEASMRALPEKSNELKHKAKSAFKLEVNIGTDTVKDIGKPIENQPDIPIKESKASMRALPEKLNELEHKAKSTFMLDVNIGTNTVKDIGKPIENQPDIPIKENKASKQTVSRKTSKINQMPVITETTEDDDFLIMLKARYPGIPADIAEYFGEFKHYFLRGDL